MNQLLVTVQQALKGKNTEELKSHLLNAQNMEIAYVIHELSREDQAIVFRLLPKDSALFVFEQLDTSMQQTLIKSFTDERTIEFMEELEPDDRVKLFDEMPAGVVKKLINSLSAEERLSTNLLMGYPPETAGRIMTTEFISLRPNMTADKALERVRSQAATKETIYNLYVTDDNKKLEGTLSLRELIIAPLDALISDIMTSHVVSVITHTDQEKAAIMLKELEVMALPVVDNEERIVGIITIDDAMDIMEEEVTEDIFDQVGLTTVAGKENNRSEVLVHGNLFDIWKVRLPFLVITMIAGILAAMVMDGFEETLESIVAVAFFIPLVMDMGGNVGTQSATVFARGVVLGHINTEKFFKHFAKETFVGVTTGALVGVAAGIVASFWTGMPMLGIAVGISLLFTMTLAACLGFLVPYVLLKFNIDQAAGSAPIITSIKDISGLFVYFVSVNLLLSHLL